MYPASDLARTAFGSGGVGTGNHLAGELFKKMAGIDLLHIPYRGTSQSIPPLYSGDIDLVFASTVDIMPHVRDGNLRVLGVGTSERIRELPDVPAIAESLPGYLMTNWYALFAPPNLPVPIADRLQAEIAKARDDASLKERAAAVGMNLQLAPASALRARLEVEIPRWRKLIPELGLKIE